MRKRVKLNNGELVTAGEYARRWNLTSPEHVEETVRRMLDVVAHELSREGIAYILRIDSRLVVEHPDDVRAADEHEGDQG